MSTLSRLGFLFAFLALDSAASLLVHRDARADVGAAGNVEYTVQKGDTCASIATRHYGDARLVDLIHGANPGMGPAPHSLVPGRVLILPPKPSATPEGPDARLTRTKNVVEVRAPELRLGKPNDPLFRGNRVGTKESSTADVTFRDETQVKLGENTLVVILGDVEAKAARLNASDTTLVTGSLRARLSELAGKGAEKPRVATDSGSVEMKAGEAQVSVDDKKTTRLAVYDGKSTITAQQKTVGVNDGFGSKAETGRAPTPPRPLPPAPIWSSPTTSSFALADGTTDLTFAFAPAPGPGAAPPAPSTPAGTNPGGGAPVPPTAAIPAPAEWHVQLARDADFNDTIVDTKVPLAVQQIEAKGAVAGTYYARASAIDDDKFEGKWSTVSSVALASLDTKQLPGRRSRITVTPDDLACTIDGTPTASPFELDRSRPHMIACQNPRGQRATLEMEKIAPRGVVAAVELTRDGTPAWMRPSSESLARAELQRRGEGPSGVRLRLTDEDGQPVENASVYVVTAPPGMHVGAFISEGPGVYVAPFSLENTSAAGSLRLRVGDDETVVATNDLTIQQTPPEERRFELSASGRATRVLDQYGAGGALGARVVIPAGPGDLLVGADGFFEAVPWARSDFDGLGPTRTRMNIWGGRIPIGYRFGRSTSRFAPYLAIGPELVGATSHVEPNGQKVERSAIAGGFGGSLGLDLRVNPMNVIFLEASGRMVYEIDTGPKAGPKVDASSLFLSLGYRFVL